TFRAYFRTFHGELRMPLGAHPHEPWVMALPMVVLGVGAVAVGIVAEPFTHWFSAFLTKSPIIATASGMSMDEQWNWPLRAGGAAVALVGAGGAWFISKNRPGLAGRFAERWPRLCDLSRSKLYVDEIYNLILILPATLLASICGLVE